MLAYYFAMTLLSLSTGALVLARPALNTRFVLLFGMSSRMSVAFVLLLIAGSTGCFLRLISGTNIMIDGKNPECVRECGRVEKNVNVFVTEKQQLTWVERPSWVGGKISTSGPKVTADSQGIPCTHTVGKLCNTRQIENSLLSECWN